MGGFDLVLTYSIVDTSTFKRIVSILVFNANTRNLVLVGYNYLSVTGHMRLKLDVSYLSSVRTGLSLNHSG